jgi:hypothetical protein
MTADLVIANRLEEFRCKLIRNFEGSFDSAALRSGRRKGVKTCETTNKENHRPDSPWASAVG